MSAKRKLNESSQTPSKRQRKVLTLSEHVDVVCYVNEGHSHRQAADRFGIGRTQINNVMLQKDKVLQEFSDGKNSKIKYLTPRTLLYPEIDEEVWKFFIEARSKNIPVSGTNLLNKANESALRHNYSNFNGSNGWL